MRATPSWVRRLAAEINNLPSWASWSAFAVLLLLSLWLLIKWRTRHSRLLKPDAFRLDRDNAAHLAGRAEDIDNLLQQCLAKQIIFLEGESGSGKSALVRAGLLPRLKDDKSTLPLMLSDVWVDQWERGPFQALKTAIIKSGVVRLGATANPVEGQSNFPAPPLSTLADVQQELAQLNDRELRTALIIFDQFDDYQARNRERFLPDKTWLDPASLRRDNPFWEMVAQLLEQDKLRCLFVTRSDTAAGLGSVQFLGPVQARRLDRVPTAYIAELLARLTEAEPEAPVIADPDAGWNRLRDRIVSDISQQNVVLPQQLKVVLGGIQSLKRLNLAQYERVGGAAGIEALYVEQQINGTARTIGLEPRQVRAMLVALIDPLNPTKTRSRSKEALADAAAKADKQAVDAEKLDRALEQLERGEMVRGVSDPETRLTAYRLDHDYLTRGVSAAERRANRWHYLLEDGAKAFESAGSLAMRWKSLLPLRAQCRLVWERSKGTFHYGQQSRYALASLARLAPVVLVLASIGYGWREYDALRQNVAVGETVQAIWRKFEFRNGINDQDLDGAWRRLRNTWQMSHAISFT
jgi:conflict system STAND superfamily ATPase